MIELLVFGFVLLVLAWGVYYWNRITILYNQIENAKSQINVQLKRRADLVPALVETVKGYVKHEKEIFNSIAQARERMVNAGSFEARVKASNQLTNALKTLFAISENYPKLKANENFLQLQEELSSIENKIAYARQFYNDSVLRYNNTITTIPGMFFAFGRKPMKYLEISVEEKKMPKVKF